MKSDSELGTHYSQLSDNELLAILTYKSSGYTRQAIEVAEQEAAERGGLEAVITRVLRGPSNTRKVFKTMLLAVGIILIYAGLLQALFSLFVSRITPEVLASASIRSAVGLLLIWFGTRKWLGSRRILGYALLIHGALSMVPLGSTGVGYPGALASLAVGILELPFGALALYWHHRSRRALRSARDSSRTESSSPPVAGEGTSP